jgi:ubiquitin-protein ligase E3 C
VFAAQAPFGAFEVISASHITQAISTEINVLHLLANLLTFMPPRYTSGSALPLEGPALTSYIGLLIQLLARLPVGALELAKKKGKDAMDWTPQSDSDSDSDTRPNVALKRAEETPLVFPPDNRTALKLATLVSPAHITSLLTAANKSHSSWLQFVELVIVIGAKWPTKREGLLTTIVIGHGNVVFKQLWRDSVRDSQLGKDETDDILRDTEAHRKDWPPLLLLTELYTQALLTMGDDEFFSTAAPASNTGKAVAIGARNPFSVTEVIALSRRLLNIVFPLYWNDMPLACSGIPISWELVRGRITKCLQAIHSRELVYKRLHGCCTDIQ